ncbi:MAG: glycosyltransferase family 4 protein [Rhodoferax sp.]|nr:glycosyltransferase family 4 protein [Rhodoferax sp.]
MKVVHVVRQYLPSVGGLEEVVRNLAQQQARGGRYTPTVLTLNRVFRSGGSLLPASETLDGVAVQRLGFAGSERYPLCPQVAGALRGADLVHVHGIEFFFDYLALLHPLMRQPLLASTHGGFFHSGFASRLKQIYFRSITRLSAMAYQKVIATSENDGQLFGPVVPAERLQVIENGVDMGKFAAAAAPELHPVMIYFGRWSVNKGLLECLDVLAALCQQQPEVPWQLLIAGREYDLDATGLQNYAQALGIAGRIQLHPNPGVAELRQLIGRASYFLCLSHHEGFGIAPIEAISAGLIPLLSPIPPFVRLFQTTGAGALLDAPSAAQQARQISQLHAQMQDAVLRQRSTRSAAQAALHAYSWQGVAARYARQYDLALGLT